MHKTEVVLGMYSDKENAEDAIKNLREGGYNPKEISVILQDKEVAEEIEAETGAEVAKGATAGAATGAVVGGLAGLIAAVTIPGIGPLLVAGPIATALGLTGAAATTVTGAATGAVAGGLVGGLVELGMPEEEAEVYAERIESGDILVAVPTNEEVDVQAIDVLSEHGADEIRSYAIDYTYVEEFDREAAIV